MCFIPWVVNQYCAILLLKSFQLGHWVLSLGSFVPLIYPIILLLEYFLTFWPCRMLQAHLVYFLLSNQRSLGLVAFIGAQCSITDHFQCPPDDFEQTSQCRVSLGSLVRLTFLWWIPVSISCRTERGKQCTSVIRAWSLQAGVLGLGHSAWFPHLKERIIIALHRMVGRIW